MAKQSVQRARSPEEAGYKLLFERSPQPMWVYDRETLQFLAVNEAAIEHYGFSREEFLRMTIRDIRPQEDWPMVETAAFRMRGKHFQAREWRHVKKDGTPIVVEITSNDEDWAGRPARLVLVTDITERKKAQATIVEWRDRYEAAVRASGQILFDWDTRSGQVTYGGNLKEKLGVDAEELNGGVEKLVARTHPDDQAALTREVAEVLRTRRDVMLSFRLRRQDDEHLYFEARGHFVADAHGEQRHIVGFLTDITERRRLEAQFIEAQKMEAVGQLAGGIAHDFNNLLGVILGYGELLTLSPAPPEKQRDYLGEINRSARRAAELTRQLLAFSRRQMLEPRVLNLNAVLNEMEGTIERLVNKEIEVSTFKAQQLDVVKLDPRQLEQAVMNLVVNARDAMPRGGKLILETANVELDGDYCRMHPGVKPGRYVMLAVSDTGVGMDSQTLSRIFEPFYTTKASGKGTGLGLAMVYGTVRQSGGHIFVYSEPNEGAIFKLYFPSVNEPLLEDEDEHKTITATGGTETVLVAEDESSYRKLVVKLLTDSGYRVLEAANGAEAVAQSSAHAAEIDLLLTDAVLPKLNGKQVAEELKKQRPGLRVLYMSGYTTNVVVHHGMLDPGIAFLHKPFTPTVLLRKIREVLEKK